MPMPKYAQIEAELRQEILDGKFDHGDRFYSEAELVRRFGVSSITVIRAIRDLVDAGLLVRYQGKGTFVSRARKNQVVEFNDIEVFAGRSDEETVEVVSFEEQRDPEILDMLALDSDDSYMRIERVRRIGKVPYLLQVSHIPVRYIRRDVEPGYYASIYTRLRDDCGLRMYDLPFVETDEVLFPAPAKVAEALAMDAPEPVVLQTRVSRRQDGSVIEFIRSYKKWDYFKIEISTAG